MNSRERILTSLDHQEPDRVPIVIGVSNATSMKMTPYRNLKKLLDIQEEDNYLYSWPELGTAKPGEKTLTRLQADVRSVTDSFPTSTIMKNLNRQPGSPFYDDWGIGQVQVGPNTWYPHLHPLSEADSIDLIEKYPWPDMTDPSRVAHVYKQALKLANDGEYAVMGVPWLLFPLERAFALQGMDRFLTNLVLHQDFAIALLRVITDLCISLMEKFLDKAGPYLDIVKIGDDLGMQDRLIISPAMYRQHIKPFHAELIASIKSKTRAKVLFHSDGDIFNVLDDLIEIGVDILNPIQTSAGRIANLLELKSRYGGKLCFCGGIDTQQILPYGTTDDVIQEVRRVIQYLAPGGGYLLAAVHTITDEVPAENILAMIEAVNVYGRYPL